MLPVSSSVTIPLPSQTLVATPLPDNNTLRVPVDNVAPPVSNAQINNNARGNSSEASAQAEGGSLSVPVSQNSASPIFVPSGASSSSANSSFIAQLVSQEVPQNLQSELQGTLAAYEKLAAISYVKYKPSNAALPQAEPTGVFGRLLQQTRSEPVVPLEHEAPVVQSQPSVAENIQTQANSASVAPAVSVQVETQTQPVATIQLPKVPQTLAYTATIVRNNTDAQQHITDNA